VADKFRRSKVPRHLRLYHSIMASEAWHHLSGNAVKVLLHLVSIDNGQRNGQIAYSTRLAARDTGLSERTCIRCFRELEEKGFIACTQKGSFDRKVMHASTWRYTWAAWPEGKKGPTRDFEKWRPDGKTRARDLREAGALSANQVETVGVSEAEIASEEPGKSRNCDLSRSEETAALNSNQRLAVGQPSHGGSKQSAQRDGDALTELRLAMVAHLGRSEPGEQTRLALRIDCPGGTLSKFKSGAGLPAAYIEPLRRYLKC
jgi:hypothetical protein